MLKFMNPPRESNIRIKSACDLGRKRKKQIAWQGTYMRNALPQGDVHTHRRMRFVPKVEKTTHDADGVGIRP